MVDFVLKVLSELGTEMNSEKKAMLGGLPGPGYFWIESPYPTGYRVSLVRFLNQVRLACNSPGILSTNRPYLINWKSHNSPKHIWISFRKLRIFLDKAENGHFSKFQNILRILTITQKKNRKIDFSFISAQCASFMQISNTLHFWGGWGMSAYP